MTQGNKDVITPTYFPEGENHSSNEGNSSVPPAPVPTNVAAPEPVAATPAPAPAKLVELTQTKLDTIIRDAQGRTARDLRLENNRLRKSLESALAAANPDASELEKTRAALESVKLRLEDLTAERQSAVLEAEIIATANTENFVDAAQATLLLDKSGFVKGDGSLDLEAAKAAVRVLASKSPHLIKGTAKSGARSTPDQNVPQPPVRLESLFGRGSNASEANRMAISNPTQYQRLRTEARKRGLI